MTKEQNEQILNNQISELQALFCPYGWLDLQAALTTALEVEEDADWIHEQITQFQNDCGGSLEDIDPVYIVYDAILQEARNDISDLIDYDFLNDFSGSGLTIEVAGNFMATSFDYSQEAIAELTQKLLDARITMDELSTKTKWFLEQLEIKIEQ
ncbi:MAG: hypothetical protein ACRC6O_13440 [Flavobacterium sp.]